MASKPKSMDTLLEVLKLAELGYKIKVLERNTGVARNTIKKYLRRLNGRKIDSLTPLELAELLYENDYTDLKSKRHQLLIEHFKSCSTELKETGVTRQLYGLNTKNHILKGMNIASTVSICAPFLITKML
ncbi:MAG: hypothetical protein IPP46_17990 [Bacteroidetes bacterium]|nr:hypothetical protein [Bacteroidota bacterium]